MSDEKEKVEDVAAEIRRLNPETFIVSKWCRAPMPDKRRDTGDDETGAYTLAITALLRSIKSTRMAKKNAIARHREARKHSQTETAVRHELMEK